MRGPDGAGRRSEDVLGDRIKGYERRETDRRFMDFAPVIARMDGRGFSQWTKGLARPFDENLSRVMIEVTRRMVAATGARIGYTQSDEITLVLLVDDPMRPMTFDAKAQKLCSTFASMTTAFLITECIANGGDELAARAMRAPQFDARVFQVPNRTEAANAVLWRTADATRNAVSSAARSMFPHSELQGRSGPEMRDMMAREGVDFDEFPDFFRFGSFLQARSRRQTLPPEIRERLGLRDEDDDDATVERRSIERIDMPRFGFVSNREDVIFERAEPTLRDAAED